jgi:hypothetical protein
MPRGDKSAYTDKQKRKARHIEESMEKSGVSAKTAARRAWATVNKQDGGGLKKRGSSSSGSGRKKSASSSARRKVATSRSTSRSRRRSPTSGRSR